MSEKKKNARMLAAVLAAAVLIAAGFFCWHHIMLRKDARRLQDYGYRYASAGGDYALSYLKFGNDTADHIVVALAGRDVDDYGIRLIPMIESLGSDLLFVPLDRAGCGLSGDTHTPQTVAQVVDDYRTALKNANIEPPYVLLPHAYGGVEATYWESKYPGEIEGVFYLDGTVLSEEPVKSRYSALRAGGLRLLSCFGMARLTSGLLGTLPPDYTAEQSEYAKLLNLYSFRTAAKNSAEKLLPQNCKTVYESIVTNDIPKAYADASAFSTAEEYLAADAWARAFRTMPYMTDEARIALAEQTAADCMDRRTVVIEPYLQKLGNCEYIALPGDSFIFMQRPMDCAVLFSRFLTRIERGA